MPVTSTNAFSTVMAQETANFQKYAKIQDEIGIGGNGINTTNNEFKSLFGKADNQKPSLVFDGGAQARAQEANFQAEMQSLNRSALSTVIDEKEIDEQFKFLTDLLIEQYKDPDPEQETDHAKNIQTMVQLMTAGEQLQIARLMKEQNALIRHNNRLAVESRIGMKAQYQDVFFEVREGQENVPIFYRLGRDAVQGKLKIQDKNGNIIQEIDLKNVQKGDHQINWDLSVRGAPEGVKASPGVYFIEFDAMDRDKKQVEKVIELEGIISDIDTGEDGYPEYYVAGIKVDGKITRVSRGESGSNKVANYIKDLKDSLVVRNQAPQMPQALPVQAAPAISAAEVNPTILENNPISPNLEAAFQQVAQEMGSTNIQ